MVRGRPRLQPVNSPSAARHGGGLPMEQPYNAPMRLETLGRLRLLDSDFGSAKQLLLLGYLALEGRQSRRVLAELFWPDARDPRDALSTALRRLNQAAPDVVTTESDQVATELARIAIELVEQLDAGELEAALSTYQGTFLAGLDVPLGEELEEWVFSTREYLASRVREAHLRLGGELLASGKAAAAARQAEAAQHLAGAPEVEPEDFGRMYRLLAAGKSPRAAEVRAEAEGFGIEVSAPRQPSPLPVGAVEPLPFHNLPAPTDAFVGRDPELLEISRLLTDTHTRLVTLHGPGGVGKSHGSLSKPLSNGFERARLPMACSSFHSPLSPRPSRSQGVSPMHLGFPFKSN